MWFIERYWDELILDLPWTLNPLTDIFVRKRKEKSETQEQMKKKLILKTSVQTETGIRVMLSKPSNESNHQKLEEVRRDCPLEASEGALPCQDLILNF